ncbi:MAG: hypothetical protein RBT70_10020, partial [Alphaproteobacteria bacterium]|nr:hypothetical protein [Alphaproteobacteria bacterium]
MSGYTDNVLAISHFNVGLNRVFEDYCNGIKANCTNYHYFDYIASYKQNGQKGMEQEILRLVEEKAIQTIVLVWWSCDLSFDIQFLNKLREKVKIVINYYDTEYYYEGVDAYYAQTAHL